MGHTLPPVSPETTLVAPFAGTIVSVPHGVRDSVPAGTAVAVIEAMKMEHEVVTEHDATVTDVRVAVGETVAEGQPLVVLAPGAHAFAPAAETAVQDGPRDDLQAVHDRHHGGLDEGRPDAVAKRHDQARRTARENLADLLDADSFVEYGPLMFAAQERRRSRQELIERTPADGLVGGVGAIAGESCVAMSYDYTVLAGTQGMRNHQKKDRLFELAQRRRLPVVLFAEGGGGRPGDVDMPIVAGLDVRAFQYFALDRHPVRRRRPALVPAAWQAPPVHRQLLTTARAAGVPRPGGHARARVTARAAAGAPGCEPVSPRATRRTFVAVGRCHEAVGTTGRGDAAVRPTIASP
jgi:pyruvate/2-oxoglutarate dehydrogenase complex dihydrolipoamide acyltransferase (E2) component